ncbi:MAG: DUF3037 domain-containing protein [Chloroflexi bacterium]|nr:DUF3037 domain-containing protein [Chloroflexota bacterium]
MRPARYAVVRYVADPARNEPLNVGVVIWDDHEYCLRVDADASQRVVRENPFLARDAMLSLEAQLQDEVEHAVERAPGAHEGIARWIGRQSGYPVLLTEPRATTILTERGESIDDALDRLVSRLVVPRRRGGGGLTPVSELAKQLRPLIREHQVYTDRPFRTTRTGVPRTVDFFVNSYINVGLDALQLAIASADDVILRADAEAHKIEDIRSKNPVEIWAYCHVSPWDEMQPVYGQAFTIMSEAGATKIFTKPDDAAEAMRELIGRR